MLSHLIRLNGVVLYLVSLPCSVQVNADNVTLQATAASFVILSDSSLVTLTLVALQYLIVRSSSQDTTWP